MRFAADEFKAFGGIHVPRSIQVIVRPQRDALVLSQNACTPGSSDAPGRCLGFEQHEANLRAVGVDIDQQCPTQALLSRLRNPSTFTACIEVLNELCGDARTHRFETRVPAVLALVKLRMSLNDLAHVARLGLSEHNRIPCSRIVTEDAL
jgi:hypothetical protein